MIDMTTAAYSGFEWVQVKDNIINHILNLRENSTDIYILGISQGDSRLTTRYYPLAPEKVKITVERISPFYKDLLDIIYFTPSAKLNPKNNSKLG